MTLATTSTRANQLGCEGPKVKWADVTRAAPCPICGKGDWCTRSPDGGAVVCHRTADAPAGWRFTHEVNGAGVGWIHVRDDGTPTAAKKNGGARRNGTANKWKVTSADLQDAARRYVAALTPDLRRELADALGIQADVIFELGIGWSARRSAWTHPERDAAGVIVGIVYRDRNGEKRSGCGHGRGLSIPSSLADLPDPVLIGEGASDVLAGVTMGLAVVGRPSNTGGVEHLAELLQGREVVVVGAHDEKPDGRYPGRDGAQHVARNLARRWGRPVRWAMPPAGTKDVRAFWTDPSIDDEPAVLGRRLLAHLEATAETIDPGAAMPPYATAAESSAAVDAMAQTARGNRAGAVRLSDLAAEWLDRRGHDVLGPDLRKPKRPPYPNTRPLSRSEQAVKYAAGAIGKSREHFYRLARLGRVRRHLRARSIGPDAPVNGDSRCGARATPPGPDELSDRALTPLTRLLPGPHGEWPDRTSAISQALRDAAVMADGEGKALNGRHVRAVVDGLLGVQPKPSRVLWQLIAAAFDAAKLDPAAPPDVVEHLRAAHVKAVKVAAEGATI